jgi:hypothetical protein
MGELFYSVYVGLYNFDFGAVCWSESEISADDGECSCIHFLQKTVPSVDQKVSGSAIPYQSTYCLRYSLVSFAALPGIKHQHQALAHPFFSNHENLRHNRPNSCHRFLRKNIPLLLWRLFSHEHKAGGVSSSHGFSLRRRNLIPTLRKFLNFGFTSELIFEKKTFQVSYEGYFHMSIIRTVG